MHKKILGRESCNDSILWPLAIFAFFVLSQQKQAFLLKTKKQFTIVKKLIRYDMDGIHFLLRKNGPQGWPSNEVYPYCLLSINFFRNFTIQRDGIVFFLRKKTSQGVAQQRSVPFMTFGHKVFFSFLSLKSELLGLETKKPFTYREGFYFSAVWTGLELFTETPSI